MSQTGQMVNCPHCGAENHRSLLITMCHACRRNLSAAAQAPRPAAAAARPPTAAGRAAPPPAVRKPQMPPSPQTPARTPQPPGYRLSPGAAQQPVSRADTPGRPESPVVGCAIVLFALVAFGTAFAIVAALSK